MKRDASDKEDITIDTKQDSEKKECNVTGSQWIRNCPKCNTKIQYKNEKSLKGAIKNNSFCKYCSDHFRHLVKHKCVTVKDLTRSCPQCNSSILHKTKRGRNRARKLKQVCGKCQKRNRVNLDVSRICKTCESIVKYKYHYQKIRGESGKFCRRCLGRGKIVSSEVRKKLRKIRIDQISKLRTNGYQVSPSFNRYGCHFINEYGNQNGYNFQHAENGGEFFIKDLGYWVDGYDKEKNVVFEYDEPRHYSKSKLKEKDIRRMNEIKHHLGCKFIRYNEKLNEVVEY